MKRLLLLGCMCVLGSCALMHTIVTPIGELYREALPEWTGENIQKLTKQWGYPTAKDVAPNGNPLWIYSCSTNEGECKTHIETDGDGVIVNWQVEGSACPCGGNMGRYYNPSPKNPSRKGL